MQRKMIVLLSCGLMAASVASAGGAGPKPAAAPVTAAKCLSIADLVMNSAQFSTLLTALQAANLVDTLKSGQYTVFAPTDAAFNKLPSDVLAGVLNDPELLKSVLLYHVVPGKVNAKQVMSLKSVKSAQGGVLGIQMMGSKVMVGGANVVQADVMACNGVVHVIDTVLLPPMAALTPAPAAPATSETSADMEAGAEMPDAAPDAAMDMDTAADTMPAEVAQATAPAAPMVIPATPLSMPSDMMDSSEPAGEASMDAETTTDETMADEAVITDEAAMSDNTVYDVIVADDRFSTLRSLLSDADLTETLMGGEYTVFAPTDEAFAKVDAATLAIIASDPALLKQVLLYHVVAGKTTADQVMGTAQLASAEGQSLNITKEGSTVKIGGATIIATDMAASNGVVHVIDSVLLPPDLKLP